MSGFRQLFSGFGDVAEDCCRCFCFCFAIGPMLMLFGIFVLINAAGNPRQSGINAYNRDVSYWGESGGGLQQWDAVFPSAEVTLVLNSVPGSRDPVPVENKTMTVQATSASTPLDDSDPTLATYSNALWFEGDFPLLGTDWPSADPFAVITPISPTGVELTPIRVQLFECREMEQPGRACAYPPPPAPVGGAAGPAMAPGGAPGPQEGPAAGGNGGNGNGNGNGNGTATARRLLQFSSDMSEEGEVECRAFQRQIRYLTALPLVANPPRKCFEKDGENCTGRWEVVLDDCNLEYGALVVDVSEETYNNDRRVGAGWCDSWGAIMPTPNATVVSLRSASDPYVAAAVITSCQFNFGPTRAQYAQVGVNIMAAGAALTAFLCCCLGCLVYARPEGPSSGYGDSVPGYQGIGYGDRQTYGSYYGSYYATTGGAVGTYGRNGYPYAS